MESEMEPEGELKCSHSFPLSITQCKTATITLSSCSFRTNYDPIAINPSSVEICRDERYRVPKDLEEVG